MSKDVLPLLLECLADQDGYVELRYHSKIHRIISVQSGRVENASVRHRKGVGVRVLDSGVFGFASCSEISRSAIRKAMEEARAAARKSAASKRERIGSLAISEHASGHFELPGVQTTLEMPLDQKLDLVLSTESKTRRAASSITSSLCTYQETLEEKAIASTDGAGASYRLVRPEFRISAVAESRAERQSAARTIGVTGGWDCLFRSVGAEQLSSEAAATAVDLLSAKKPRGGRAQVILAPSIVGLLVHEAIGHTVEADFVEAGSVAQGKLNQRVASELVTLCDSGISEYADGAAGTIPMDDEGVISRRTPIITQGILTNYLHDRASAARFEAAPTGSARAWEYSDAPLIRMRNTYIEPGEQDLVNMIEGVDEGYLLDGARNGQADSTGEFMFNVERAHRIEKGKIVGMERGVTISGIAFDVMQTVDAVSREFKWDLGSGYCGKGQPAKVDAGGPYVRCRVLLGGEQ
jgi:TldD protein